MKPREWDLICMGRAAVDLYADQIGASLEGSSSFSKYLGGCPGNIAVGSSRLGLRTAMLSRVGDEAMGRFVSATLEKEGVDLSLLTVDPERLTGLVLLGVNPPDKFPLIFYRENCADMAIEEKDFSAEDLSRAGALLVTGTHFSTEKMFNATKRAVELAKSVGTKVILDIDFRPVLWGLTGHGDGESRYVEAQLVNERLQTIFPHCDLIVGTEEELKIATACDETKKAITELLASSSAIIVEKKGARGSAAYTGSEVIEGKVFCVDVLNVLGAGDAFLSGFLRAWLKGESLETSCTWGNASGALVVTRHACSAAIPFWSELNLFLEETSISDLERHHETVSRQRKQEDNLCVLAFDHRDFFNKYHVPLEEISFFKKLVWKAVKTVNAKDYPVSLGLIIDEEYSSALMGRIDTENLWSACAIEEPQTFPLAFSEDREAGSILKTRPKEYRIKVLVRHPEKASPSALETQKRKLRQLYQASLEWGQELLVEIIADNLSQVPSLIEEYYQAGIYPAWWKLQPNQKNEAWNSIRLHLEKYDTLCRGVLLLGQREDINVLSKTLEDLSSLEIVKGFAVGRSIWEEAADKWFEKEISEKEVITLISSRYVHLIESFSKNTMMALS
jgi:5-dehydro-2-deoxygluconokinase